MYMTRRLLRHKLVSGDELWLNALSGAVDILTAGESGLVTSSTASGNTINGDLLDRLRSRGYLYPDPVQEAGAFESLVGRFMDVAAGPESIRNLIVCPTYACNLRCVYCFEQRSHTGMPRDIMDTKTATAVLAAFAALRDLEPEHRYSMGLFGGEPLMAGNRRVVSQLIKGARQLGLPVTIVTNGFLISSYMKLLVEYAPHIHLVQITVDGPEEIHDSRRPHAGGGGTFEAIAAAIGSLLEQKIKVLMRVNIDRSNVTHLPALAEVARKRGWTSSAGFKTRIAPVRDHLATGSIPEITADAELLSLLLDVYDEYPPLEDLFGLEGFQVLGPLAGLIRSGAPTRPRVHYCEANHGGFRVAGPDGYLYPCPEAIGQPGLAIGRYLPELELWEEEVRKWSGRSIARLDRCRECPIGPLCGGGCTYAAMAQGGDASQPVCDQDLIGAVDVFIKRRVLPAQGAANIGPP